MRHLAPTQLPTNGLWTAQNYLVGTKGPMRRPGYNKTMGGNQVAADDLPLIDLVPLWKTDGTQKAALLTSRYLYNYALNAAPTAVYWVTSNGTVSVGGTTLAGTSTEWESAHTNGYIMPGDVVVLSAATSMPVVSVTDDTTIVLSAAPGSFSTGTAYYIRKTFQVEDDTLIDSTVVAGSTNKIILADQSRPAYTYDGTTFESLDADALYCPACVLYFGGSRSDRLWLGNIKETTTNDVSSVTYYRQRIRWSSATDITSFGASDYIDLPYASGQIVKMLNIRSWMIVYMLDAIFYGRPANDPDLPYVFDRLNTSGVGLLGVKAVVPYQDGHFFVGPDNIYYLHIGNNGLELTAVGTPVVSETVENCQTKSKIYGCHDPDNHRIMFGFPEAGEEIAKVWSYNYHSKAWSYDVTPATFIANPLIQLTNTIDGLTGTIDGLTATYPTIDALGGTAPSVSKVYKGQDGYVSELGDESNSDDGVAINAVLTTGDLDLGLPDRDKTFLRLTVRLSDRPSGTLAFAVAVSLDGGNSWKDKGTLTIASTKVEDKVDFRATGSAIRVRLTSTSAVEPYTISEISLKAQPRGEEVEFD